MLAAAGLAAFRPAAMPSAAPLLALWFLAPEITIWIGRTRRRKTAPLRPGDRVYLRKLARRTWFYFENFAGPQDNWLPADNYQAPPHEEIAHRSSPTNIGMLLLASATAWDFGYIGRADLAARTEAVFDSLDRLERYRGHFYNWYDTRTLAPLEPRYVSVVDSGNLAAALIAFASALREAAKGEELEAWRWDGLEDVLALLGDALGDSPALSALAARVADMRRQPALWLFGLGDLCDVDIPALEAEITRGAGDEGVGAGILRERYAWLDRLRQQAKAMLRDLGIPGSVQDTLSLLAGRAVAFANAMDFAPLYDKERSIFTIGYNVSAGRIDPHHYDLLASEARLASFFAIAKGDVPPEHWFHLERPVTRARGGLVLISWNGSMFEYLMPRLLLRSGPESLLGQSEQVAALMQQRYGRANGLPWGISESGYGSRDADHRYRYQAFGVPGLGLRRGLARDMVVAPYASALALAILPGAAVANLRRLEELGARGLYGMFEAVDFTPDRRGADGRFTHVDAYMAHHQGMILCAIGNALTGDALVGRFAADVRIRLGYLLLSERIPREIPSEIERIEEMERPPAAMPMAATPASWEPSGVDAFPQMHLLSNGRLASWVSEAGGGGLRWRGQAVTRFRADPTRDADGVWIYIHDADDGALWSATRQPTGSAADEERVVFHAHLAEYHRRAQEIETRLDIGVGGRDDVEIRRLTITNEGARRRRLRLTGYGEVVLAPPLGDERHPAFSKLFVGSEAVPHLGGLLFERRPRSPHETPPVLLHFVVGPDGPVDSVTFESDRRAFIGRGGRGGSLRRPVGASAPLTMGTGWTMDPVMALQVEVELEPYARQELAFVTVVAASREAALEIAERHATLASLEWALADAASEIARAVQRVGIGPSRLAPAMMLASQLVYPHGPLRADAARIVGNRLGQPDLWGMALSGDLPILVLRTGGDRESGLLAELVGAHQFWRRQGLESDLVVLQTGGSAYVEPMRESLADLLREVGGDDMLGRRGGIHLLFSDQIGPEHCRLIEAAARAVLDDGKGDIEAQIAAAPLPPPDLPALAPSRPAAIDRTRPVPPPSDLSLDNGIGGFTPGGREYHIRLEPGRTTPAPWANILANEDFGTLMTEAGGTFTWATNSGENRLTPWANDPVLDRPSEVLYLRDEETAEIWTVTPAPAGGESVCDVRHGAGHSGWSRRSHGIEQHMEVFVPEGASVKLIRLRIRNLTARHRRVTSTYYAEWLLGALASLAREHVFCARGEHERGDLLIASSHWTPDFAGRAAFLAASRPAHGFTTDRREFLGREADIDRPAGLHRWGLAGAIVAGGDPCAAYQLHHDLGPRGSDEVIFVLGEAADAETAAELAGTWADPAAAEAALAGLVRTWDDILGRVEVETPHAPTNVMINRWLIYQARSSRILARTGYYQSSGAIGFRDQLQDMLALLWSEPDRVRAHLIECARHQFSEGDVLHWWHPPSGRGVRTRCSDDMLWLPYVAAAYVAATGDVSLLGEPVPFLGAPPLAPDEMDRFARFDVANEQRPFIEHCERALDRVFTQGAHGLPLIGSGDWNDGMDRLGVAGRGESVWLAWFGAVTAESMAGMQLRLDRAAAAAEWRERAAELRRRAEASGWDGNWYRRAYDDDGRPVGSAADETCRIDSISQSWAIFAGASEVRATAALAAARAELVLSDRKLARLLWPPFDSELRDPGYIGAYPPGVRENGGQYSHAVAWLGLAFAAIGDGAGARDMFDMLNPLTHAADTASAEHYRTEPYAAAGDICSAGPAAGRGGWSWYSGAAAWGWRLVVEGIFGIRLSEGGVAIDPALPPDWPHARVILRRPGGTLEIRFVQTQGPADRGVTIEVDGHKVSGKCVAFPADGAVRSVLVTVAAKDRAAGPGPARSTAAPA